MAEITKKDLKDALKGLARAKDVNDLAGDLVRTEKKVDDLTGNLGRVEKQVKVLESKIDELPTREEFSEFVEKIMGVERLKFEHDRMKKIIREKLGVEI